MASATRLTEIDLLRFFAAMAVLLFHYAFAGNNTGDMQLPIPDALEAAATYGYLGVDLFFLISGFVIALSAQRGTPLRFLLDRLIRLYPAFLVAVLLTALVRTLWGSADDDISIRNLLLNLSLFAGIFEDRLDLEFVDGVYWSLMVELQFYGLVLLALLLGLGRHLQPLMLGWLAITLASDYLSLPGWLDRLLLLEWSPYFIAGALFHEVQRRGLNPLRGVAIALCLYLSVRYAIWRLEFYNEFYNYEFEPMAVSGIVIGLYLLFMLLSSGALRPLRHPWLIWLGGLTYPLYLLHQNIGYITFRRFDALAAPIPLFWSLTAGMLLLALGVHLLVERGLGQRLRRAAHRRLTSPIDAA